MNLKKKKVKEKKLKEKMKMTYGNNCLDKRIKDFLSKEFSGTGAFFEYPLLSLQDIVLSDKNKSKIMSVIKEQNDVAKLRSYGLEASNKILLSGRQGFGKTTIAKALAGELGYLLCTIDWESFASLDFRKLIELTSGERIVFAIDGIEKDKHRSVLNAIHNFPSTNIFVFLANMPFEWHWDKMIFLGMPTDDQTKEFIQKKLKYNDLLSSDPEEFFVFLKEVLFKNKIDYLSFGDLYIVFYNIWRDCVIKGISKLTIQENRDFLEWSILSTLLY